MGLISRVSSRTYRKDSQAKQKMTEEPKRYTYPLVCECDMPEEMRVEAQELCVTACEKYSANYEHAAKFVKEQMDKKFGAGWHIVIGEAYASEVRHELKSLLHMYIGGTTGVLLWKCC